MQFKLTTDIIGIGICALFFVGQVIYEIIKEVKNEKKEKEQEEKFNEAINNLSDEEKKELRKEAMYEYLKIKPDRINNILEKTKKE